MDEVFDMQAFRSELDPYLLCKNMEMGTRALCWLV